MPAIFLHGLGQTPDSWSETLTCLETETALCPDLAALLQGQGYTYGALYRAFAAFCGEQKEPLDLCGLSLGAILALEYAIEHPDRVRPLVLIGGQYKMPQGLLRIQNVAFRLLPRAAFQGMGFSKEDVLRLTASMAQLDFSGDLEKVACPALAVCGGRDRANRRAAETLARRLPCGELRIIAHAGHEVNTDAPAVLAEVLKKFYSAQ